MMITWVLIIILPFLGTLLIFTPKHLKPGVLSAHLGKVALIGDALMGTYSFIPLFLFSVQLRIKATNLHTTVDVLCKSLE